MWDYSALTAQLLVFTFAQGILAAALLRFGGRYRPAGLPLAIFFLANCTTHLPDLFTLATVSPRPPGALHGLEVLAILANLALAPLLWLYVRALTTERYPPFCRRDLWHFCGLFAGLLGAVLVLFLPFDQRDRLLADGTARWSSSGKIAVIYMLGLITIFYGQCAIYIVAVIRRLAAYRNRLRDIYASTEHLEMRWIGWLAMLLGGYWLLSMSLMVLDVFFDIEPDLELAELIFDGLLVFNLAIWGLRQRPGFDFAPRPDTAAETEQVARKYERSALSAEQSDRIAAKITQAMRDDLLYRNPNLSLWMLAKHISVTSYYVSQTLNATMGETFFDYVNGWRIEDAKPLIQKGEETVLAIAYEVGFNSRSSFYTAFKRSTGMTPTAYRQAAHSTGP